MYEVGEALANIKDSKAYAEHVTEYQEILQGVKGDDQTKKLASQFISRFYIQYPEQSDQSIDAMLDLCEDLNVEIRKQAIKDLPHLCKDNNKTNLAKIADVLTQLLSTEDASELHIIQHSLMQLFRRDTTGAIMGIFSQVHNGEDAVRERALRFLHTKLKTSSIEVTKEAQAQIVAEVKKAFGSETGLTADDFQRLMGLLSFTQLPKTVAGQLEIVNMIMGMAELDKTADFNYGSVEMTDRLLQCAQQCIPFFSTAVKSTPFCEYLCMKVLPHYHELQELPDADVKLQLIKVLAELTVNIGQLDDPANCAKNVYERLIDYMILPPAEEDGTIPENQSFEFTKVECLMFTFHSIGKQCDTFLKEDEERLKDFKIRLQYLARGVQGYLKKLKEFLNTPAGKQDTEDVKFKKIALRTTENLQMMIKDLFHSPPIYKANVHLSWKEGDAKSAQKRRLISAPAAAEAKPGAAGAAGGKKAKQPSRSLYMDNPKGKGGPNSKPIVSNYVPPSKRSARPTGLYQPPTGQYSSKIKNPIVWTD
jgi:hypothetical protein